MSDSSIPIPRSRQPRANLAAIQTPGFFSFDAPRFGPNVPIEISSGSISPEDENGLCEIEARTARGTRRYRAKEVPSFDVQSEIPDPGLELGRRRYEHLINFKLASVVNAWRPLGDPEKRSPLRPAKPVLLSGPTPVSDLPIEFDVLITMLRNPSLTPHTRRRCIIEVEGLDLSSEQTAIVLPLLRRYIDEQRGSNDPADLVAVGSAIRAFVANANAGEALPHVASLLATGGRAGLPINLELELAKMVVRKLTARPPTEGGIYPDLSDRLLELAETYLNPRLLGREKYGATALNAVLGLVLARSGHGAAIIAKVRDLGPSWFQQLTVRRLEWLKAEFELRANSQGGNDLLRDLAERISDLTR